MVNGECTTTSQTSYLKYLKILYWVHWQLLFICGWVNSAFPSGEGSYLFLYADGTLHNQISGWPLHLTAGYWSLDLTRAKDICNWIMETYYFIKKTRLRSFNPWHALVSTFHKNFCIQELISSLCYFILELSSSCSLSSSSNLSVSVVPLSVLTSLYFCVYMLLL